MTRTLAIATAFLVLLAGPILMRSKSEVRAPGAETLVIVTPHNEATRHEFEHAFSESHLRKTGKRARIDWRTPGGTSEISRYLASEYLASFQNHWVRELGRAWNGEVQAAFDNARVLPAAMAGDDTGAQGARREFLASRVGCGMDLFFGGGSFDFALQAAAGRLVDAGIVRGHPELFGESCIPQTMGGEPFWDMKGRWVGACLGAFGICYNVDSLKALHIQIPPSKWGDLADPRLFGMVALSDPTQSGSAAKAFEMLIQQQMQLEAPNGSATAVAAGWKSGLRLIQNIAGNARYFTDSATKTPWDVAMGDAGAGMCIDFYGRVQSEAVRTSAAARMLYITPEGGSSSGADPIGMLRGAPHPELAREFMEFVLSPEGQRLWNWKVGAPGGPMKYALRRLPIRPDLYAPSLRVYRSDPDVNPYGNRGLFHYNGAWTGQLFLPMSFIIRCMCIQPHDELRAAWRALMDAGFPPEALAVFHNVDCVDYATASGRIRDSLRSPNKIEQVRLAKEIGDAFRARYLLVAELARQAARREK